ncbi:hypothetical protein BDV93DRAFT_561519 [Ceratobasidium sp. AG-I]|nr:hypothetical protein BDV93DRAFT_561519 [Ceratobasidium sp. AG-I]
MQHNPITHLAGHIDDPLGLARRRRLTVAHATFWLVVGDRLTTSVTEAKPEVYGSLDGSYKPCLPVVMGGTRIKKSLMLDYFEDMWEWQGGAPGIPWPQGGPGELTSFTVTSERLPSGVDTCRHPDEWSDHETSAWVDWIHRGQRGELAGNQVFQFRRLADDLNDVELRTSQHPQSGLTYGPSSRLFVARLQRRLPNDQLAHLERLNQLPREQDPSRAYTVLEDLEYNECISQAGTDANLIRLLEYLRTYEKIFPVPVVADHWAHLRRECPQLPVTAPSRMSGMDSLGGWFLPAEYFNRKTSSSEKYSLVSLSKWLRSNALRHKTTGTLFSGPWGVKWGALLLFRASVCERLLSEGKKPSYASTRILKAERLQMSNDIVWLGDEMKKSAATLTWLRRLQNQPAPVLAMPTTDDFVCAQRMQTEDSHGDVGDDDNDDEDEAPPVPVRKIRTLPARNAKGGTTPFSITLKTSAQLKAKKKAPPKTPSRDSAPKETSPDVQEDYEPESLEESDQGISDKASKGKAKVASSSAPARDNSVSEVDNEEDDTDLVLAMEESRSTFAKEGQTTGQGDSSKGPVVSPPRSRHTGKRAGPNKASPTSPRSEDEMKRGLAAAHELNSLIQRLSLSQKLEHNRVRHRMSIFIDNLINILADSSNSCCLFCSIGPTAFGEITIHCSMSDRMKDALTEETKQKIQHLVCEDFHNKYIRFARVPKNGLPSLVTGAPFRLFPDSLNTGIMQGHPVYGPMKRVMDILQAHEFYWPPQNQGNPATFGRVGNSHMPATLEEADNPELYLSRPLSDAVWDRLSPAHIMQSIPTYLGWLLREPFKDKATGLMYGGLNGVRWAVLPLVRVTICSATHPSVPAKMEVENTWTSLEEINRDVTICLNLLYRQVATSIGELEGDMRVRTAVAQSQFKYRELVDAIAGTRVDRIRSPSPPPSGQTGYQPSLAFDKSDPPVPLDALASPSRVHRTGSEPPRKFIPYEPQPIVSDLVKQDKYYDYVVRDALNYLNADVLCTLPARTSPVPLEPTSWKPDTGSERAKGEQTHLKDDSIKKVFQPESRGTSTLRERTTRKSKSKRESRSHQYSDTEDEDVVGSPSVTAEPAARGAEFGLLADFDVPSSGRSSSGEDQDAQDPDSTRTKRGEMSDELLNDEDEDDEDHPPTPDAGNQSEYHDEDEPGTAQVTPPRKLDKKHKTAEESPAMEEHRGREPGTRKAHETAKEHASEHEATPRKGSHPTAPSSRAQSRAASATRRIGETREMEPARKSPEDVAAESSIKPVPLDSSFVTGGAMDDFFDAIDPNANPFESSAPPPKPKSLAESVKEAKAQMKPPAGKTARSKEPKGDPKGKAAGPSTRNRTGAAKRKTAAGQSSKQAERGHSR